MSSLQTILSHEGNILWNKPELKQELWKIAKYSIFERTYVTTPTTPEIVRDAIRFAEQHSIVIHAEGNLQTYLQDPEGLVKYHQFKMGVLSHAKEWAVTPKQPLRVAVSPFVLAGTKYAMLSQRCIIADPLAEDRIDIALATLNQIKGFCCLLVCSKDKKRTLD